MNELLGLFFFLFFLLLFKNWKALQIDSVPSFYFQVFFAVKVSCGLVFWWIYSYHYHFRDTSDAFRYFDDAMVLADMLKTNPVDYFKFLFGIGLDDPNTQKYFDQMHGWTSSYSYGLINDNPLIIRLNAIVGLLSMGSFHVHTVCMAFLSSIGAWFACKGLAMFSAFRARLFVAILMVLPSYLFWSSSVLKEVPLLLGLGFLLYLICSISYRGWSVKLFLLLAAVVAGLFFVKGYVIMAFLPALLFFILDSFIKKPVLSFVGIVLLSIVAAGCADVFYPSGDFYYVLGKKQVDFYNVANSQNAGSVIEIPQVNGFFSFVKNSPEYLVNAYLRPFPNEGSGLLYLFCKAEIVVTLLLLVLVIFTSKFHCKVQVRMILMSLLFILILGLIIGATVPILGAIVRYKIPALFLFAFALCFCLDEVKWKKIIPLK